MPTTINGTGRPANWTHPRQCTAMKSDNSGRCTHYALRGSTVCRYHGGAAPQVQRAIRVRRMSDLYGPMFAKLAQCLESGDLDAILKSCAIISRHHLADTEAGRLPAEHQPGALDLGWLGWLDSDELREIEDLMASYEALARERMDAGIAEWKPSAEVETRELAVIDVVPENGNGNGNGETR